MSETRTSLHRIATHVLSCARYAVTGKIGLRATPGGFGTPAFGDAVEVVRVAGTVLVHEREGHASYTTIDGATVRTLAAFVGTSLDGPFEPGADAPELGDPDAPLSVASDECDRVAEWFALGWRAIDAVCAQERDAMALQLWPEHFDAGTSVAVGPGDADRCNLGASPGDAFSAEPYLYLGPWSDDRPGDTAYWNAPFGAVLPRREVLASSDPHAKALAFFEQGLRWLEPGHAK